MKAIEQLITMSSFTNQNAVPSSKRQRIVSSVNTATHGTDDTEDLTEDVDDDMNIKSLDRNSIVYIFSYIQPSLLFSDVSIVCKDWSQTITDSNFVFGYFKNTCKLQSQLCDVSQMYSKDSLKQWKIPYLQMELRKRKLKVSGKKEILVERLYSAMSGKYDNDCETSKNTENHNNNTSEINTTKNKSDNNDSENEQDKKDKNDKNIDNKCGLIKADRSRMVKMKLRELIFNRTICQNCLCSRPNDKSKGNFKYRKKKNVMNQSYYHFRTMCHDCNQLSEFNTISLQDCIEKYGVSGKDLNKFGINIIKNQTRQEKVPQRYEVKMQRQSSKPRMLNKYINGEKRYQQNDRGGYIRVYGKNPKKLQRKKTKPKTKPKRKKLQNKTHIPHKHVVYGFNIYSWNLRSQLRDKLNHVIEADKDCFVNLAVVKQIAEWKYQTKTVGSTRRCTRFNNNKNKEHNEGNFNRNSCNGKSYVGGLDRDYSCNRYNIKDDILQEMREKYGKFYDSDDDADEYVASLDDDEIYQLYINSFTVKNKNISFKFKRANQDCKWVANVFENNEIFYNAKNLKRDINTVYELNVSRPNQSFLNFTWW